MTEEYIANFDDRSSISQSGLDQNLSSPRGCGSNINTPLIKYPCILGKRPGVARQEGSVSRRQVDPQHLHQTRPSEFIPDYVILFLRVLKANESYLMLYWETLTMIQMQRGEV